MKTFLQLIFSWHIWFEFYTHTTFDCSRHIMIATVVVVAMVIMDLLVAWINQYLVYLHSNKLPNIFFHHRASCNFVRNLMLYLWLFSIVLFILWYIRSQRHNDLLAILMEKCIWGYQHGQCIDDMMFMSLPVIAWWRRYIVLKVSLILIGEISYYIPVSIFSQKLNNPWSCLSHH